MDCPTVDSFTITINGAVVEVRDVSSNENLLNFLRRSRLTGSKEGCAEGDCGACSVVLVDHDAAGRPAYRAINSCLALLPSLAGREILTVEGIGCPASLHPVQEAMVKHYGSQCGYCTPGFVASLYEGYHRSEVTTVAQIEDQLCGNLCRCTGYRAIREAAKDAYRDRQPVVPPDAAPLTSLDYSTGSHRFLRPLTLDELFDGLESNPGARLVGGATEIAVEINKLFRDFPCLISTDAVPELQALRSTATHWEIGAAVTLTRIEEALAGSYPSMQEMLRAFASRQIHNRATLGGNLVTASPIGDSAPVLISLDADVVMQSRDGERVMPLEEFFVDYRRTALQPGEILRTIRLPKVPAGARTGFYYASRRREMDISMVSAAFRVSVDAVGKVTEVRLVFGGIARKTMRSTRAEAAVLGRPLEESLDEVSAILREEFTPISDVRASADYRRAVTASLWERFVREGATSPVEQVPPSSLFAGPAADDSRSLPHESAVGHVTGHARYVEDTALRRAMLEVWPVLSPHAHADILSVDISEAAAMPGIHAILLAKDITGENNVGPARHDEPALADGVVLYNGHVVALVVGESKEACRLAADQVRVEYAARPAILGIAAAAAAESYHTDPHRIVRGEVDAALAAAPHRLKETFDLGGQEHFYLETQAAWAEPTDDGGLFVASSTQHPSEIQTIVAEVVGIPRHLVTVETPRMGGGFGGKETQGNLWAALAALAARKTGLPVRVQLDRDLDMRITGKRHPFHAEFDVGFDEEGKFVGCRVMLLSDGGWSLDLSQPVADRALYHLDNAYYIPAVEFSGRVVKTHAASNTAFRGFGGPQGMLVIEEIIARMARRLGRAPEAIRRANLYQGEGATNTTHYGQDIENNRLSRIWDELLESSDFVRRRASIDAWNATQPLARRGLAITPVKFGISFTFTSYNQAGALVLLYRDGSAQVNHGGTEMGQGLQTKILGVAMRELGLPSSRVRVMVTRTDKVPNTSATAASCGSDLNGAAVADACQQILVRLAPVAVKLLESSFNVSVRGDEIVWQDGCACWITDPAVRLPLEIITERAYMDRISLSATGFYRTPIIHWDWAVGQGHPFHYYAMGAAVTEVEVDVATGMPRVLRVDILHDVGNSLNPGVDRGQIEGGFVQGMGWLTSEELLWNAEGRLLTHSASTYAIPTIGDAPVDFRVGFLEDAAQPRTIGNSKAVGEPPLMLAISVREAIRDAVASALSPADPLELRSPATGEAVYRAMHPQLFKGS
jgi:xanthine dehydrogenase molybdopterin binding subunit/xanthine dehydrogenase small subunit